MDDAQIGHMGNMGAMQLDNNIAFDLENIDNIDMYTSSFN